MLSVKIETLMWLLPIVFIIHDFEEIIMLKPWLRKNHETLQTRFPQLAARFLPHFETMSTSSFAFAVLEIFALLVILTTIAVEGSFYSFWAGILIGFFIHLLLHIAQFAVYRKYVPVVITSILGVPYCLYALYTLNGRHLLVWGQVIVWSLLAAAIITVSVPLAHRLAAKWETWVNNVYCKEER